MSGRIGARRTEAAVATVSLGLLLVLQAAPAAQGASGATPPGVKGASWEQVPVEDPPAVRKEHSMLYEASVDRFLMAGEYYGTEGDGSTLAWTFTPATESWDRRRGGTDPRARIGPSMAYDESGRRAVLFGGVAPDGTALGDTWVHETASSSWRDVTPPTSPPPRSGHTLVMVPGEQTIVLFGGRTPAGEMLSDTWHYDLASGEWTLVRASGPPSPRADYGAAFEPALGKIVMFGGRDTMFTALGDVWTYEPAARRWDAVSLQGAPAPRWGSSLAYHPTSERLVLFGGIGDWSEPGLNDTWLFDASAPGWERLDIPTSPSPRFHQALAFDPQRDSFLLFGGSTGGYSLILGDTWRLRIETEGAVPEPVTKPEAKPVPARFEVGAPLALLILGALCIGVARALRPRRPSRGRQEAYAPAGDLPTGGRSS